MNTVQSTKNRALTESRRLTQLFGFNGFTLQDLAEALGIKKPSLYTHFESKEKLGEVLAEDFGVAFENWTRTISVFEPDAKIGALFELYLNYSSQHQFCPFSSLIGEYNSLPKGMAKNLRKITKTHREWLKEVVDEGQKKKIFRRDFKSEALVDIVMALGLGSQQMARVLEDPEKLREMKERTLKILKD